MNDQERKNAEQRSLFKDPRFARKAFQDLVCKLLDYPVAPTPPEYDAKGAVVDMQQLRRWNAFCELKKIIPNPTQAELAAFTLLQDNSSTAFTVLRDTAGAKPIDETKANLIIQNDYEGLTDEELEFLEQRREQMRQLATSKPLYSIEDPPPRQQLPEYVSNQIKLLNEDCNEDYTKST